MLVMVMFVFFEVLYLVFDLFCLKIESGNNEIKDLCIIKEEVKLIILVIGW